MVATNVPPAPDFGLLMSQLCAGDLSADDAARLPALLEHDAQARETFVRYMNLHAELMWRYNGDRTTGVEPLPQIAEPVRRRRRIPVSVRLMSLAASLLVVAYFVGAVVYVLLRKEASQPEVVAINEEPQVVRSRTETAGPLNQPAESQNRQSEIRNRKSEIVPAAPRSLASGTVELNLKQGTHLVLKGPARWQVIGDNRVKLEAGTLVASVPQRAIGFTVETPSSRIVDLGTRFGVSVADDGTTEVSVLTGIVDVSSQPGSRNTRPGEPSSLRLSAGQGVRVATGTGAIAPLSNDEVRQFADDLPRAKPQAASKPQVLAYYRLGEDDPQAAGSAAFTRASGKAMFQEPLAIRGRLQYTTAVAWAQSQKGLSFGKGRDQATLAHCSGFQFSPNAGWVLEAWARPEQISHTACVAYLGEPTDRNGLGIYVLRQHWAVVLDGRRFCLNAQPCQPDTWTHLALVQTRPRELWLYVNGRPVEAAFTGPVFPPTGSLYVGGTNLKSLPDGFEGQIDEVRLSQFATPFATHFDPTFLLCPKE